MPRETRHFRRGFLLLEALVALVILSIVFCAVTPILFQGRLAAKKTELVSKATRLAQNLLEERLALPTPPTKEEGQVEGLHYTIQVTPYQPNGKPIQALLQVQVEIAEESRPVFILAGLWYDWNGGGK